MFRSILLRGVSAGALAFAFFPVISAAQEALPAIDIAAERGGAAPAGAGPSGRGANGEGNGTSYTAAKATSALKTDAPILDTPRSVQVIPKQVLEDNQVLNTQEAVKFVSGVQTAPGAYYDNFLIRGFGTGGNVYRNGLKLVTVSGAEDPAFIDRVEIMKGPAAMLYGRIQPGGLVNFATKKPQEEAARSIEEQFGSWGLARTTVDVTGPVTQDKSLLYRLIGVYDHADSFVNFKHRDNGSVLTALTWKPTTQFEANVGIEYNNLATTNRGIYGQQIPALALSYRVPWLTGRPANLPRNWTQNVPGMYDNLPDVMERVLVSADWTYHFNDQWKVTNRAHYQHVDEMQHIVISRGFDLATGLMNRKVTWNRFYRDTWSLNLDLSGKLETGPFEHNLLFGFDFYDHRQVLKGDNPNASAAQPIPSFNIWAPYYGDIGYSAIQGQIGQASGNILQRVKQQNFGYYVQDDISYDDFIHFLIGGRYDVAFDAQSEIFGTQAGSTCFPACDGHYNPSWKGNPTERKISPNGGLLFKLTPEYSIYASYSESFGTSNAAAVSADGTPFKPQEGQQYELGAKANLLGGKVTASVAAFDLYLKNVLAPDPSRPNTVYQVATGKVRSRGVEFDLAGQVTDNISLIGSYTYDDAIIIENSTTGTSALLGKRWAGVPRHAGNLWAKYDTAPGLKEGWAFGAGFYANGLRQGNNTNSYQLPGYVTFDTMIGYRTVVESFPVEAQLNVKNIGDAKYFEATDGGTNAYYGQPRTFIGSLKVKF